ncbi:MAG: hypothetical protein AAFX87_05600, partial [Bacteroidota bacterium]
FSKDGREEIKGITKLAKLDFLLRYPLYLERALKAIGKELKTNGELKDYERQSVESKMVRFKYGPWDFRYRKFLNLLIGKGLINIRTDRNAIMIAITEKGLKVYRDLKESNAQADFFERARVLRINFNMGGTRLKNFIYQTFPEIGSLNFGQEIDYGDKI